MTKIVFFGGTGMSGQCAVEYALKEGFQVRLLVRDEATLPSEFKEKVEIIKGDVTCLEDVRAAVKDQELVCVALGTRNDLKPTTVMSDGLRNIIEAMKETTVTKFSVCLSAFLFMEEHMVPAIFINIHKEHKRMLELTKESGLQFRAVLPPHIADAPSAKYVTTHDRAPGHSRKISKHDLGKFMVDCLLEDSHECRVIGICTVD